MAKLSDLPLELVRHIASFLCPDWPGALLLDHDEGWEWVHDVREVHSANRASLLNFSYTAKAYNIGLAPELVRSAGVFDRSRGNEVRKLSKLLRYLLHNPAISPGAVRKLFIYLNSEEHPVKPSDLSNDDMQLLEEVSLGFGIDIRAEDFHGATAVQTFEETLTTNSHFLNGFLVGLLILHLPNIRDLSVLLPTVSHMAVTQLLRRVQELRAEGNEIQPILHLQSIAIRTSWKWEDLLPSGFETLFSFGPRSSVYFGECDLPAPLPWSSNITSLVFREVEGITLSTVCKLISYSAQLTKFIYIHNDHGEDAPVLSPGSMFQALKKHGSSLKTLCLAFFLFGESYLDQTPPPYIDSFEDFTVLEQVWINCSCFGDRYGVGSNVLRTIPTSLWRLHLAGSITIVEDDLLRWAEILSGKRFGEEDDEGESDEEDGQGDEAGKGEDDEEDMMEDDNDNDYVHIPEHLAWDISWDSFWHEVHQAFRDSKWVDFFEAPSPLPGIF
ncbi:hypothetical protein CcaCcLH18_09156 [Colletotrichum camelliae]|nr:hypothetical protein CcaCcLH18_09156 [Colletotrichum camelliae]